MRRPLINLLIAFALLLQGVGSAWAATRMAAADVQVAAHIDNLPPCHQAAAKAASAKSGMSCCGSSSCHCVMGCGMVPALSVAACAAMFQPQAVLAGDAVQPALQTGHYASHLRPPAALQA